LLENNSVLRTFGNFAGAGAGFRLNRACPQIVQSRTDEPS
jgi:hypothetical protein